MVERLSEQFNQIPPPPDNSSSQPSKDGGAAAVFVEPSKRYFEDVYPITEAEVLEAVRDEATRHRLWRKGALKKLQIDKLEQSVCLQYVLESHLESRSTSEVNEAVTLGQFLEGQLSNGGGNFNSNPWDYEVVPPDPFVSQVRVMELPGTSAISTCPACKTDGSLHCFHCRGQGQDRCTYCRGTGMKSGVAHPAIYTHPMVATFPHADLSRGYSSTSVAMVRNGKDVFGVGTPMHLMSRAGVPPPGIGAHDLCAFCRGRGVAQCIHCRGSGRKPCPSCRGSGSTRAYTRLKVHFTIDRAEWLSDCDVPHKLLQNSEPKVIFEEQKQRVVPLASYSDKRVNEASKSLCASLQHKCIGRSRVLHQQHTLLAYPIVRVAYTLGSTRGVFYVFGMNRRCHMAKYPTRCSLL